jgi:3-oxoacyl-[acyl-carrier protein] reductase
VALVTGVGRRAGIGFAVAGRLAAMGASLFVHAHPAYDRQAPWGPGPDGPEALAAELAAMPARVERAEADFEDADAPARVVRAAVEWGGHVDVLVANHARSVGQSLEELTAEEIDRHFAVNARATLLLVQAFAAQHDGRPGGRVIMMSSGQHRGPMPEELPYAASKAALNQMTPTLAAALAPRGITVNTVDPGPTDTGWATPAVYDDVLRHHPRHRWGVPDDAARLIGWLATDEADWITGQVIDSRGGF